MFILNVLLDRDKNNDSTYNNLSWAYQLMYKNESANYFADKALAILPNTEYEFSNKGNALRGLGKQEEAMKYYDMALEKRPDFSHAVWGKAMIYQDLKSYDKSLEFLLKYRSINPDDEESTRSYITSCYRQMNQLTIAIDEYESYFEKDPSDTSPLFSIARIYYEQKDYTKALEYYNKILEIDPEDAWAYFDRADCYVRTGRMDDAVETLKKAIKLDSECLYDISSLDEYEKLKKYKKFKTIFQ